MVRKFICNIIKKDKGVTLIEIIVSIFIIAIFSAILIANFPIMQKKFALSRATYKLAQNLGRVRDMGFSGVTIKDGQSTPQVLNVKGYGMYIDLSQPKQYLIYADVPTDSSPDGSKSFDNPVVKLCSLYNPVIDTKGDCVLEIIDIPKEHSDLYIKGINNIGANRNVSINFNPPNPTITINNIVSTSSNIKIIIGLNSDSSQRSVLVNKTGLIDVK